MEVYVMKDGRRAGPFRVFELKEMLEGGEVSRDDLVWFREQESWRPLREVDALGWIVAETAPEAEAVDSEDAEEDEDEAAGESGDDRRRSRADRREAGDGPEADAVPPPSPREAAPTTAVATGLEVRAWSRFWARLFDWQLMLVLVFGFGAATGSLGDPVTVASSIWFWVLIVLAWAVLEAVVLSSLGTTPGKRLLGLRVVRDEDGRPPLLAEALKRSLSMAFFGWGFGLFIVRELSWVVSYFSFRRLGSTVWDRQQSLHVEHERLTPARLAVFIAVFLLVILVLGIVAAPFGEALLREWNSAPGGEESPPSEAPASPPGELPPNVT